MADIETADILLLWQAVRGLNDEVLSEMALVWREVGDRALASGQRLSKQRSALAEEWGGAAASKFDERAARSSLSMYTAANIAVGNAASLETVAAATSTAQREMQTLWTEYVAKRSKIISEIDAPTPKAGTLDGGIDLGRLGGQISDATKAVNSVMPWAGDSPMEKLNKLDEEYNQRARAIMRPLMNAMTDAAKEFKPLPEFDGPTVNPTELNRIMVPPPPPGGGAPPPPPGGAGAPPPPPGGGGKAPTPPPGGRAGRQATPPPPPGGGGKAPTPPPGGRAGRQATPPPPPPVPPVGAGGGAGGPEAQNQLFRQGMNIPPPPGGGLDATGTGAGAGKNSMAPPLRVTIPPPPGVGAGGGAGGTAVPPVAKIPPNAAVPPPPGGRAGLTLPGAGRAGAGAGSLPGQRAIPPLPPALGRGASGPRPPGGQLGAGPTLPGTASRPPAGSAPNAPGGGFGRTAPGMGGSPPPLGGPARRADGSPNRVGNSRSFPTELDPVTGRPIGPDLSGRRGGSGPVTPSTGAQPAIGGRRELVPPAQQRPARPNRDGLARTRRAEVEIDGPWSTAAPERPDLTGRRPVTATPTTGPSNLTGERGRGQVKRLVGPNLSRERRKSLDQSTKVVAGEPMAPEEQIWELPPAKPALVDAPKSEAPQRLPAASLPGAVARALR